MSRIIEKYKQDECREESGIFYSDDTAQCIYYDKDAGYYCGDKEPLDVLMERNGSDGWTGLCQLVEREGEGKKIVAGGGTNEEQGFVAFFKENKLQWIQHMQSSEAFNGVTYESGKIIATAIRYPYNHKIEIPEQEPHNFIFTEKFEY